MARGLGTHGRFAAAYLLLAAAVGAGVGTFIVLVQRPGPAPPPPWSSWKPAAGSRDAQVREIADYVGSAYRLPSGNQLTAVNVGFPSGNESFRAIAVFTQPSSSADFQPYDESKSVTFVLCGGGNNCTIDEGVSLPALNTVLRREALELALYSFEYAGGVDNVLVLVPPGRGQKRVTSTLFFHRSDFSSPLRKPLRKTLPQRQPPLPGQVTSNEQQTVDALTVANVYRYVGPVTRSGYGNLLALQPLG